MVKENTLPKPLGFQKEHFIEKSNNMILRKISLIYIIFTMKNSPRFISYSLLLIVCVFCCTLLAGCGIYSFRGSTLAPDIKSITVVNFNMATAGGPANLALQFNEKIKEYYQRNTNLALLPSNGDLILEGTISGYEVTPTAPTANDQAAFNRLTVTVQVKFTNNKDEEKNFDQSFSFFKDFPQSQTLNQVESRLIPPILDQLIQDIFNKSAGDW
ncbi:MAG: LptE family protein [Spirosomataceae bacterium]